MLNSGVTTPHILNLDGGEWSFLCLGRFTSEERAPSSLEQESGWGLGPVWTRWRREKIPSLPLPGI